MDKSTDDTSIAGHAFTNSMGAKTPQEFTMQLLMPWLTEIPDAAQQTIYMALNSFKLNQSHSPRFRVARRRLCPCVQSPNTEPRRLQRLLCSLFCYALPAPSGPCSCMQDRRTDSKGHGYTLLLFSVPSRYLLQHICCIVAKCNMSPRVVVLSWCDLATSAL